MPDKSSAELHSHFCGHTTLGIFSFRELRCWDLRLYGIAFRLLWDFRASGLLRVLRLEGFYDLGFRVSGLGPSSLGKSKAACP